MGQTQSPPYADAPGSVLLLGAVWIKGEPHETRGNYPGRELIEVYGLEHCIRGIAAKLRFYNSHGVTQSFEEARAIMQLQAPRISETARLAIATRRRYYKR